MADYAWSVVPPQPLLAGSVVVAQHFGTLLLTDLPSDYFSTSQCMLIFLELLLQWLTN